MKNGNEVSTVFLLLFPFVWIFKTETIFPGTPNDGCGIIRIIPYPIAVSPTEWVGDEEKSTVLVYLKQAINLSFAERRNRPESAGTSFY